jgi:ribonuclease D
MASSADMVEDSDALQALAGRLVDAALIGLDTEFLRERTYRAELCLLQLCDAAGPICVDPIRLTDLAPLRSAMSAPRAVKVLHAARQDIEVLQPVLGLLSPIFDTQVAAALAGFPAQVGYAELVRRLLGHELPKAHTRTDWSRRPLAAEQVEYALDDVRYLEPLHDSLRATISRLGRDAWLEEELAGLGAAANAVPDPQRAWLRVKGLQGLDESRSALARELAAWRERRAIARNRPRGWILDDLVLREIVARVPRSAPELAALPGMPEGTARHSGAELLAIVAAADVPDPPPPLPQRARPDPQFTALVKKLAAITREVAEQLGVAGEILATRRDLEELARGSEDAGVLSGWRRAVIGERLAAAR